MVEPKQAKKIPFEQLDAESQQYYYDMFKKYIVRKQISDTNKKLTSLFIKKMRTSNPKEYSKGFNQFNNYFADSNLISKLSYDEHSSNFLRNMSEDQFNYYLKRTGNDFSRKIALICYSSRPSERIPNRLSFEAMQAYANMQHYVLSQSKLDKNASLELLLKTASKKVRKDFESTHNYAYSQLPIAEKRTDYKSVAKKMAPIWKKMIYYYIEQLKTLNPKDAANFIYENFVFTESDKSTYFNELEQINAKANKYISEQREIAKHNAKTMPEYFILSEYEEVFSKKFEESTYEEIANNIIFYILYDYLKDPIFEEQKPKSMS